MIPSSKDFSFSWSSPAMPIGFSQQQQLEYALRSILPSTSTTFIDNAQLSVLSSSQPPFNIMPRYSTARLRYIDYYARSEFAIDIKTPSRLEKNTCRACAKVKNGNCTPSTQRSISNSSLPHNTQHYTPTPSRPVANAPATESWTTTKKQRMIWQYLSAFWLSTR